LKKGRFFNYKTLLGFLVSLLGLYLGFRKFDGAAFLDSMAKANLALYALAMVIMIFTIFLRAWRWQYLVRPLKKIPMKDMFAADMICYFGNNVFPLRLGEILRCYALSKVSGLSAVSIFGTVVLERLLDTIVFAVILILSALIFPGMPSWIRLSTWGAIIFVVIFLILFYIIRAKQVKLMDFVKQRLRFLSVGRFGRIFDHFVDGILTLRATPHLGLLTLQSIVIWGISIFVFWLVGVSLNIYFSMENLALLFIVTSAIISVPAAPGYVGTYHAGAIGVLMLLGYDLTASQTLAVLLHAVGFISLTVIGLIYFLKYNVNINEATNLNTVKSK